MARAGSKAGDPTTASAPGAAGGRELVGAAGVLVPCPVLVGRTAELELLDAALTAACDGRGSAVFLLGEAGMGKSRLAHEVAAMASSRGARVLRGRAVPGSGAAAFRPLTEALAPVAADVAAADDGSLAAWLPALSSIVPTVAPPHPVDVTTPVRGEAVLRLLASACAPAGGLLVLEDLHWADPETVALVEHLGDNLDRAPVLCVATLRSDEESPGRELARRLASRRAAQVVHLPRLNDAQVAAMVHGCTGGADAERIERIATSADGVPFLVEELLVSPGLPASLAEGVQARLADLPPPARDVLVTAAAFGRHFDWRLLARATGATDDEITDALDRGMATQLLAVEGEGFRFRHVLTAEAVFQSVIPPRRQAAATAALTALDEAHAELPVELREVAARLAERAGHPERAGRLHLELGDEALRRGALHTATDAFRRAAELLPEGEPRDAAGERLVEALVLAGRVDDALELGRSLALRLAAPRAGAMHLRLAGAAATAARWPLAAEHIAAARGRLEPAGSPSLQAELAIREAELALGTSDTAEAEERAHEALAVARAHGLHDRECEVLQLLGRCARRASLDAAERWFREALAAAEAHGLALWRLRALHELGTIALLERSEVDALLEAQAQAEQLGAVATVAVLDLEIAAGYAGLDDAAGQIRHGEQAARRGNEVGLDLIAAWGWQHVALGAALLGDQPRAAEAAEAARAAAAGDRDIEGFLVGSEVFTALVDDDLDRALAHAERFTGLLRGSATAPPAHHRAAWPLLLAVAGRPEAVDAIEEIEATGVVVNRGGRAWLGMARAVETGRRDPHRAAELAAEADADLAHMPRWQSLARRLVAEAAAADGWSIPKGWLADAESCLRRLGHPAAADACRRLRGGHVGELRPEWARLGITRREAEVLVLVIEGWSNRDIAERLFLSVRTVEKHVESLLRKTGTRTRTQLAHVTTPT